MFDVSVSVQTIARSLQRVGVCKENGTSALYSLHHHVSHNINDSPRAPLILYTWLAMQKPPFHTTYCNRSAGSHSGLHHPALRFHFPTQVPTISLDPYLPLYILPVSTVFNSSIIS